MRWVAESPATIVSSAPLRSCISSHPNHSLLQRRRQGCLVHGLLFDFHFLYVWLRWLLWLLEDDWTSIRWFSCLVLWRWCLIILIWSEFRRPSRDLRVIIVWYPTIDAAKREVLMTRRGFIVINSAALIFLESVYFEILVLHQVVEVVRSSLAWVLLLILLLLLVQADITQINLIALGVLLLFIRRCCNLYVHYAVVFRLQRRRLLLFLMVTHCFGLRRLRLVSGIRLRLWCLNVSWWEEEELLLSHLIRLPPAGRVPERWVTAKRINRRVHLLRVPFIELN